MGCSRDFDFVIFVPGELLLYVYSKSFKNSMCTWECDLGDGEEKNIWVKMRAMNKKDNGDIERTFVGVLDCYRLIVHT